MGEVRFIERSNANIIEEVFYPVSNIPMYRFESLVDFVVKEPALIHLYNNRDNDRITCEQIFRLLVDIPNEHLIAYTVYADERESITKGCSIILRQLYWDKQNDIKQLKQFPEKRAKYLQSWPTLSSKYNVFDRSDLLKKILNDFDSTINHGISLDKRASEELPIWRDIELMRRYDWGELCSSWGTSMQNIEVETLILNLLDIFKLEIDRDNPKIGKIELDYRFPLDLYQKILYGLPL